MTSSGRIQSQRIIPTTAQETPTNASHITPPPHLISEAKKKLSPIPKPKLNFKKEVRERERGRESKDSHPSTRFPTSRTSALEERGPGDVAVLCCPYGEVCVISTSLHHSLRGREG
jgi:hypothetical protein